MALKSPWPTRWQRWLLLFLFLLNLHFSYASWAEHPLEAALNAAMAGILLVTFAWGWVRAKREF